MKGPVDLSVVMGVYNRPELLPATLESVRAQTDVNWELIVVNDGSTDPGVQAVLEEFAASEPRTQIVTKKNEGLTRALIDGCERAATPWIVRQDADDYSLPGRFAALLQLAQNNPDAVLLASSARYVGPQDERLYETICTADPEAARYQVLDGGIGPPAHGAVMFAREAYETVGGYRSCFYYGQDSDLWMRLAEIGGVAYTPDVYYCYRLSPGAISGSQRSYQQEYGRLGRRCRAARRAGKSEDAILIEAELLAQHIRTYKPSTTPMQLANSYYYIASLLESSDPAGALSYYRQALSLYPWLWRAHAKQIRCMWRLNRL